MEVGCNDAVMLQMKEPDWTKTDAPWSQFK